MQQRVLSKCIKILKWLSECEAILSFRRPRGMAEAGGVSVGRLSGCGPGMLHLRRGVLWCKVGLGGGRLMILSVECREQTTDRIWGAHWMLMGRIERVLLNICWLWSFWRWCL